MKWRSVLFFLLLVILISRDLARVTAVLPSACNETKQYNVGNLMGQLYWDKYYLTFRSAVAHDNVYFMYRNTKKIMLHRFSLATKKLISYSGNGEPELTDKAGWSKPSYAVAFQFLYVKKREELWLGAVSWKKLFFYRFSIPEERWLNKSQEIVTNPEINMTACNVENKYYAIRSTTDGTNVYTMARYADGVRIFRHQAPPVNSSEEEGTYQQLFFDSWLSDVNRWDLARHYRTLKSLVYHRKTNCLYLGFRTCCNYVILRFNVTAADSGDKSNLVVVLRDSFASDLNGWEYPQFYETLVTKSLWGGLVVMGKTARGLMTVYYDPQSGEIVKQLKVHGPPIRDDEGWGALKYYYSWQHAFASIGDDDNDGEDEDQPTTKNSISAELSSPPRWFVFAPRGLEGTRIHACEKANNNTDLTCWPINFIPHFTTCPFQPSWCPDTICLAQQHYTTYRVHVVKDNRGQEHLVTLAQTDGMFKVSVLDGLQLLPSTEAPCTTTSVNLGKNLVQKSLYPSFRSLMIGEHLYFLARNVEGPLLYHYDTTKATMENFTTSNISSSFLNVYPGPPLSTADGWSEIAQQLTLQFLFVKGLQQIWFGAVSPSSLAWFRFSVVNARWLDLKCCENNMSITGEVNITALDTEDKYYTIRSTSDGAANVYTVARYREGLRIYHFDGVTGKVKRVMNSLLLSDESGWNSSMYYKTMRSLIYHNSVLYLGVRQISGYKLMKFQVSPSYSFLGELLIAAEWSDAKGWNIPQRYETIQCFSAWGGIVIASKSEEERVIKFHNPTTGGIMTINGANYFGVSTYADATGWDNSKYYSSWPYSITNFDTSSVDVSSDAEEENDRWLLFVPRNSNGAIPNICERGIDGSTTVLSCWGIGGTYPMLPQSMSRCRKLQDSNVCRNDGSPFSCPTVEYYGTYRVYGVRSQGGEARSLVQVSNTKDGFVVHVFHHLEQILYGRGGSWVREGSKKIQDGTPTFTPFYSFTETSNQDVFGGGTKTKTTSQHQPEESNATATLRQAQNIGTRPISKSLIITHSVTLTRGLISDDDGSKNISLSLSSSVAEEQFPNTTTRILATNNASTANAQQQGEGKKSVAPNVAVLEKLVSVEMAEIASTSKGVTVALASAIATPTIGMIGARSNTLLAVATCQFLEDEIDPRPSIVEQPFAFIGIGHSKFAHYTAAILLNTVLFVLFFILQQFVWYAKCFLPSSANRLKLHRLSSILLITIVAYLWGSNTQIAVMLLSLSSHPDVQALEIFVAVATLLIQFSFAALQYIALTFWFAAKITEDSITKKVEVLDVVDGSGYVDRFGILLDGLRSEQPMIRLYFLNELVVAMLFGVLAGIRPSQDSCFTVAISMIVLAVAYLVYLLWYRPLASKLEFCCVVFFGVVQLIMAVTVAIALKIMDPAMQILAVCELVLSVAFIVSAFVMLFWHWTVKQRRAVRAREAVVTNNQKPQQQLSKKQPSDDGNGDVEIPLLGHVPVTVVHDDKEGDTAREENAAYNPLQQHVGM